MELYLRIYCQDHRYSILHCLGSKQVCMSTADTEGTVVMNHYNTSPVDHLILSVSILLAYATDLKLTICISWEPCIDDFTA